MDCLGYITWLTLGHDIFILPGCTCTFDELGLICWRVIGAVSFSYTRLILLIFFVIFFVFDYIFVIIIKCKDK